MAWTYPSYSYFSAEYFAGNPGYPAYLARKVNRASGTRQIRGCAVSMGGRGPVDLILTA